MGKYPCKNDNCNFYFYDIDESEVSEHRKYYFDYWDWDKIKSHCMGSPARVEFLDILESFVKTVDVCPICDTSNFHKRDK